MQNIMNNIFNNNVFDFADNVFDFIANNRFPQFAQHHGEYEKIMSVVKDLISNNDNNYFIFIINGNHSIKTDSYTQDILEHIEATNNAKETTKILLICDIKYDENNNNCSLKSIICDDGWQYY